MNGEQLLKSLKQIEKEKGISIEVLLEILETSILSAYRKNVSYSQNTNIQIDRKTGEVKATIRKIIVKGKKVRNPEQEISLTEAKKINKEVAVGDEIEVNIMPDKLGRIAAQTARQVIMQKIKEIERELSYQDFKKREGELITGNVHRVETKAIFIDIAKNIEVVLPFSEKTESEGYCTGDRIKAYITEVRKTTKGPQLVVSRIHPNLLVKLFELEVPEVADEIVQIKGVAREAGVRSKIAVTTSFPEIDPVGSCVGTKGTRVHAIVKELHGEKIDIVLWNEDMHIYIANALSPAKVNHVSLSENDKSAIVLVPASQLSLAIGKDGQNVRLAARLVGWKIDIKCEDESGQDKNEK